MRPIKSFHVELFGICLEKLMLLKNNLWQLSNINKTWKNLVILINKFIWSHFTVPNPTLIQYFMYKAGKFSKNVIIFSQIRL